MQPLCTQLAHVGFLQWQGDVIIQVLLCFKPYFKGL